MNTEVREPAIAYGKKFSVEEYLAMENDAVEKYEYYQEKFLQCRCKAAA